MSGAAPTTVPNCIPRNPKEYDRVWLKGHWIGTMWIPGRWMIQVYCYNCGDAAPFMVTEAAIGPTFAGYLCDEKGRNCYVTHGVAIMGAEVPIMVPDEIWIHELNMLMEQRYGRLLTVPEMQREIADESTELSKLWRDRLNPKYGDR